MGKSKKNNKTNNEKPIKQAKIVLSYDCEKCSNKCQAGINYLERCANKSGKLFKGVTCKK